MNSKPSQQPEPPLSNQQALEQARRHYLKWWQIAADPKLPPEAAEWARNVAMSYAAAAKLAEKALAYQHPNSDASQEQHPALRLLQPSEPTPSAPVPTANIPPPSATLPRKSGFPWNDMTSLACQMVSSDAQRMMAMKTQQALSRSPAKSAPPQQELERSAQQRPEFPEGTRGNISFGDSRPVITRSANKSAGRSSSATPPPIWPRGSLSRLVAEALRALAAVAVFALATFVVFGFLHLIITADPVWCLAALAFCWLIWIGKSRSMGGSSPSIDAWFLALPPGKEIHVPASEYAIALNHYRRVAKELVGWREGSPQPETVNLRPLLTWLKSTEHLFSCLLVARYDGEQAYQFPDPLGCVQIKRTVDGLVSALFLAGELPTLSAWDHGLYDRDYELITTDAELSDALADLELDDPKPIGVPAGLRLRREGVVLTGKCLMYSFTEGLVDLVVNVAPDGVATKRGFETVLKPRGGRLY